MGPHAENPTNDHLGSPPRRDHLHRDVVMELRPGFPENVRQPSKSNEATLTGGYQARRADLVDTANLKDFPADRLDHWSIDAQHPDGFLAHQLHLSQPVFLRAVKRVRLRLKNPPKSVEDYLDILRIQGLFITVKAIKRSISLSDVANDISLG